MLLKCGLTAAIVLIADTISASFALDYGWLFILQMLRTFVVISLGFILSAVELLICGSLFLLFS